jgi:hypothetical protein
MEEKKKEGMSVRELERYAKKHSFEIFFCLLYVFASLFTLVFWGAVISIFLTGIGGIIGALLPQTVGDLSHKSSVFIHKQQKATQVIIGIALLIIAIFLAPLVFLVTGLHGGRSLSFHTSITE